jgi:hypothetical protein
MVLHDGRQNHLILFSQEAATKSVNRIRRVGAENEGVMEGISIDKTQNQIAATLVEVSR